MYTLIVLKYTAESNKKMFSKLKSVNCEDKYYFFCSTPVNQDPVCPQDHFSFKGECIYASNISATIQDSKHKCAQRGGILLPVKTKGMYEFIQRLSINRQFPDFHIGLNLTSGKFTDKSEYSHAVFDYNGEHSKIGDFPCTFIKKGIGYRPRGENCGRSLHYYCLWKGNYGDQY